jgi:hypothetical protein
VQQQQAVGELAGQGEVVQGRDDRHPAVAAQRLDELQHLLLATHVERGRRLVEQQQRRFLGERPRDEHALRLTAGQ